MKPENTGAFLDSNERLKWNNPAEIVAATQIPAGARVAEIGCGTGWFTFEIERAVRAFAHGMNRKFIDFAPILHDFSAFGFARAHSAFKQRPARTVGAQIEASQAVFRGHSGHNCRARAVAKQNGGVAVVPIDDARHDFGANHQNVAHRARRDELRGHDKPVNEARTRGFEVECRAVSTQSVLNEGGGGRELKIGRAGRDNDEIDVPGADFRVIERFSCGLKSDVCGRFIVSCDVTLTDSSAGANPFIAGFDDFFEVEIGQNPLWRVVAQTDDSGGERRTRNG